MRQNAVLSLLFALWVSAFALACLERVDARPTRPLPVGDSTSVLGGALAVNMNVTTDQLIQIKSDRYVIRRITVGNAARNLTTAAGGLYTASNKGGTALVAASQAYSVLSSNSKFLDLTLAATLGTDVRTETVLYFSLTTPQGSIGTADIFIYGDDLSP